MGGWCSSHAEQSTKEVEALKTNKIDAPDDIKQGPIADRKCTDICWVPIFIAAQVVWLVVTVIGMADGNPEKLYRPRDFQGAYCGVEKNWNDGPNTYGANKLSYTMNLTSIVDQVMQQTVCSSLAKRVFTEGTSPLLTTMEEQEEYLCDCCLLPCLRCGGMINNGGDIDAASLLTDTITARMGELTGALPSGELFNPSASANGNFFSGTDFWNEATKYFNQVCLPDCNTTFDSMNASDSPRQYTYKPSPDDPLYEEWNKLLSMNPASSEVDKRALKQVLDTAFTFKALPQSICPYDNAGYCVPMPGVEFSEVSAGADYCTFEMSAEVISAVGNIAASAFTGLGGDAIMGAASMNFGEMMGDFEKTIDSFLIVCFLSFVVGLIFLVVLRFFVGACVWISVGFTALSFFCGGVFCFIRSGQCSGVGFFDTTQQVAVSVAVAAENQATNMINGQEAVSEAMDPAGDGTDYRGVQTRSTSGLSCEKWETQTKIARYNPEDYNESALVQNYCRNPYHDTDLNRARTIWCVTSDAEVMWEECLPIGVIQPPCQHGYSIASEQARDVLWYCAWVVWALGGVFLIIILCFRQRIQLAIALNKVAAVFVARNPHIVIVPVLQAIFAILWITGWAYTACFLLSQVPDKYTPMGSYATFKEAYGTSSACAFWEFGANCSAEPGACNDKWPTGTVWKAEGDDCDFDENNTAMCYRCYPPRYVFDVRFWVSFFVFLWNNAFNVALGQILIAMATCVWFFKPHDEKTLMGGTMRTSFWNVFKYHLGSVAFGSFIVAVVQFIRYLMKYFEKQAQAQKNRVMVLLLKVLQCCIWCFEKCIQFLNKNAYIQICLLSKPFCTSAKNAFWLIMRNAFRFAAVAALSFGIHMIGYMMIISGSMVIGYYVVREMHEDISPIFPLVSYFFVSYVVAKLYMNVFALAVDSSLQCFLLCEEKGITDDFVPEVLSNWVKHNVDNDKNKAPEPASTAQS